MKLSIFAILTLSMALVNAQGIRERDGIRQSGGGQDQIIEQNRHTCEDLHYRIKWLDDLSRNPQTGYTQEWIKKEKTDAIDLKYRLQCK